MRLYVPKVAANLSRFIWLTSFFLSPFASADAADVALKSLRGHVPAVVSELAPSGDLDSARSLNLAVGLPVRDPKGLEDFVAQVCDPSRPQYRQYLTPAQFTERFGPTADDYAAAIAFAARNNLTVTATHSNRLLLDVVGSVSNIQKAFRIHLRSYHHPTEERDFYAPDSEPSVDVALQIADISGLDNYVRPHPKSRRMDADRIANTVSGSGSGPSGTYAGHDFRAAYVPGVSQTGTEQKIGLLEFDGFYASDMKSYESTAKLAAVPIQTVLLDGYNGVPTTGSDSGNPEVSLDIEMAMAMAPGLSGIVVYEAGPTGRQNDMLNSMAANTQIKQFSSSWGWGGGPSTTTDNIFKEMAAQGQSFFNASGDSDAFTSGSTSVNGVDNASLDNSPSSSPYVTEVGGTTLTTTGPGGSWASEKVWNWGLDNGSYEGTSGGVSSFYAIPSWQAGINMRTNGGSTTHRNIPDVALTANNIYVAYGKGTSGTFGGTSCAAPLWAALAALINQKAVSDGNATIGFLNPALYSIAQGAGYKSSFHDITSGNNFSGTSTNAFRAVAGYDLCSGWGTPTGQNLVNALAGVPSTMTVSTNAGFTAAGPVGGPFSATSQTIVISNASSSALTWSLLNLPVWLNTTRTGGPLPASGTVSVDVTLNSAATTLSAGLYTSDITITNETSQAAQNVLFNLNIGRSLVRNGGFETGDFSDWTFSGDTVSGNSTYDAVESASSNSNVVHSGNYGAALGDNKLAALSQTLATMPGQTYLLSFWLENSAAGSGQQFIANWNSNVLCNLSNPPAFLWTNFQFLVTAGSGDSALQFGVENDPGFFGLDDVSVTPIPSVAFRSAAMATGHFSLTWNTAAGLTYQIQYKDSLDQSTWFDLGSPIVATGTSLLFTDSNNMSASPQRFYRLILSR